MRRACVVLALLAGLGCSSSRQGPRAQRATDAGDGADSTARAPDAAIDVDTLVGADNEIADYIALPPLEPCVERADTAALRLATWNMKAARDAPLERLAEEIAAMDVDVIALQEVDVSVLRTGELDQPRLLAEMLGYRYAFAAALYWDGGVYGQAVLSRASFVSVQRHRLQSAESSEPRIALDVTVCQGGRRVRLLGVHADVVPNAAAEQVSAAAELAASDAAGHVALVGDFNQLPSDPGPSAVAERGLVDLFTGDERATFAGRGRIDYVFASAALARDLTRTELWQTRVSDHHALIAEFTLTAP
jgi:endonuclease/exonuclease/phosphatase family metal-dependent hydrolase